MKPTVKTHDGRFAEIYGDGGLRYTLLKAVDGGYVPYHGNTCCKDFFTDVFYAETLGENTSIHGFHWKPGTLKAGQTWFHMAIEFEGNNMEPFVPPTLALLNAFEARWDFPRSKVAIGKGDKHMIIGFHKDWTTRPVLISFLTLLMRLGPAYPLAKVDEGWGPIEFIKEIIKKGNPFGEYDACELLKHKVIPMIQKCWDNAKPPFPDQTYEQYSSASGAHHSGGFIAHTTGEATG